MYKFQVLIKSPIPQSSIQDVINGYLAKRPLGPLMWPVITSPTVTNPKEPDTVTFTIGFEGGYTVSVHDLFDLYSKEMTIFVGELRKLGAKEIQTAFSQRNGEVWFNVFIEEAAMPIKDQAVELVKLKASVQPPHYNDHIEEHSCSMNLTSKSARVK